MDHSASPVDVRFVDDPAAFAAAAAPALAADPIGTNVVGSVLEAILTGGAAPGAHWILTERDGAVVAVAMHTPPFPLHLPAMPDDAASAIADALHAQVDDPLPGLSGDVRATATFARRWTALTGAVTHLSVDKGVHVLGELAPPVGVPGSARAATADDLDLVEDWMNGFFVEAHGGLLPQRADRDALARRTAAGRVVLWEVGGRPVSLAGWHPPSVGVARVGPVWTPAEHRRRGFAAAVTTAATRATLAAGAEHVMLFTDLKNPTSNGVYARLGFRRVGTASEWTFTTLS